MPQRVTTCTLRLTLLRRRWDSVETGPGGMRANQVLGTNHIFTEDSKLYIYHNFGFTIILEFLLRNGMVAGYHDEGRRNSSTIMGCGVSALFLCF